MQPPTCPDCNADMVLRRSKYGPFYGCSNYPRCTCKHGAHADGTPLGIPANKETRDWRIKAHDAFDQLWKGPRRCMKRPEAYLWMQRMMCMSEDEAHIGRLNIEQCERLIAHAERYLERQDRKRARRATRLRKQQDRRERGLSKVSRQNKGNVGKARRYCRDRRRKGT
jgi:ssDNA-binding Zn-finger/Zn-ribbon topoisomerase 1